MTPDKHFEARLREWAREYSGGRYENIGWPDKSWLYNAIKYQGRTPQGCGDVVYVGTPADDVEKSVVELERQKDGYKPGRVLRAEYWMPSAPEEMKLQALRRIGLPMSRAGYYQCVMVAKVHVASSLRMPFSEVA